MRTCSTKTPLIRVEHDQVCPKRSSLSAFEEACYHFASLSSDFFALTNLSNLGRSSRGTCSDKNLPTCTCFGWNEISPDYVSRNKYFFFLNVGPIQQRKQISSSSSSSSSHWEIMWLHNFLSAVALSNIIFSLAFQLSDESESGVMKAAWNEKA